jgi:hypothetical protein
MLCAVRAVREIEFRLVINGTPNKWRRWNEGHSVTETQAVESI